MNPVGVRIPGKVMLSGEYAVLYGGAAILMPVPRYLEITETAPHFGESYSPAVQAALDIDIPEIREYEENNGKPCLKIDRNLMSGQDNSGKVVKLGLGSSAAEAVGTVKIRLLRSGIQFDDLNNLVFDYAYRAHNNAQGGIGSGADIAACAYADIIVYKKNRRSDFRQIDRIKVNHSYKLNLIWTGIPADTRIRVGQFHRWVDQNRADEKLLNRLIELNNHVADLWFDIPQPALFEALDEYLECLETCMAAAGIIHKLAAHDDIEAWAKAHGGRAKPTGAGGGDMILLIGDLPVDALKGLVIPLEL